VRDRPRPFIILAKPNQPLEILTYLGDEAGYRVAQEQSDDQKAGKDFEAAITQQGHGLSEYTLHHRVLQRHFGDVSLAIQYESTYTP